MISGVLLPCGCVFWGSTRERPFFDPTARWRTVSLRNDPNGIVFLKRDPKGIVFRKNDPGGIVSLRFYAHAYRISAPALYGGRATPGLIRAHLPCTPIHRFVVMLRKAWGCELGRQIAAFMRVWGATIM